MAKFKNSQSPFQGQQVSSGYSINSNSLHIFFTEDEERTRHFSEKLRASVLTQKSGEKTTTARIITRMSGVPFSSSPVFSAGSLNPKANIAISPFPRQTLMSWFDQEIPGKKKKSSAISLSGYQQILSRHVHFNYTLRGRFESTQHQPFGTIRGRPKSVCPKRCMELSLKSVKKLLSARLQ